MIRSLLPMFFNYMRRIPELVFRIIVNLIYSFFRLFPIEEKLIIFASERDYSDNSFALYEFIHSHYPEYHFVWATLEKNKYNNDERTKFIYHPYKFTFGSAWYISRAKYIFYTHGLGCDLKIRREQIVINLWHGIAIKGKKGGYNKSKPTFSYSIYLGDMNKKTQAMFLGCDEKYLLPLGYPRNDLMLNNKSNGYANPFVPSGFKGKVVVWMPTFRKSISKYLSEDRCETYTGLPLFNSLNDLIILNDYLESIDVCVIAKIHHLQAQNEVFTLKFSRIIFVTDNDLLRNNIQLYQMLGKTDALLTDYSSVYIDYLLLDRPIGFILDDFEDYIRSRGTFLFEKVKDIMPGYHIYEMKQLFLYLKEVSNNIDSTKILREKLLDSMITFQDNKSCERICKFCNLNN